MYVGNYTVTMYVQSEMIAACVTVHKPWCKKRRRAQVHEHNSMAWSSWHKYASPLNILNVYFYTQVELTNIGPQRGDIELIKALTRQQ